MNKLVPFQVSFGRRIFRVSFYDDISALPHQSWGVLAGANNIPMGISYLTAMAATAPPNIRFQYLLFEENDQALGIAVFQLIDFTVKGLGTAIEWGLKKMQVCNPGGTITLLLCGSAFFSGHYGFRYDEKKISTQEFCRLLSSTIKQYQQVNRHISFALIKDFIQPQYDGMRALAQHSWHSFIIDPCMQFMVDPEWNSFEDYLNDITSKYKKRYRAIAKKADKLSVVEFSAEKITANIERINILLHNVQGKASFKFAEADANYMAALKKELDEKYLFKGYYANEILVGFASSIISETLLETHFIGVDYDYNYEYEVYQSILYDFVRQGIDHKMKVVNYGRTAMEIKSNLGAKAYEMSAFIKHRNSMVNWLISPLFRFIKKTAWTPRNPYKSAEIIEEHRKSCKIKTMLSKTHIFAAIAALSLLSACSHKEAAQNDRFDNFKNRFIEKYWELNPTAALYAGYHKYDTTMLMPTTENMAMQNQNYQSLLDSLHQFNTNALNDNNKIDYLMLENQLKASMWYNSSFRSYEWNPSEYNVGSDFAQIITENYDQLDNRLRTLGKRLEKVPAFYEAAKKMIKSPTIEHTTLAIDQNRGAISVFEGMLNDSIKRSGLSDEEKMAIRVKADAAKNAIINYITWLEKDIKPTLNPLSARSFRIGKELYTKKFEYDIVSGYSADQIYAKALRRKQELHREMYKISKGLWSKYFGTKAMPTDTLDVVKMMIDTLSTRHVHRDSFIVAIKKQLPELLNFINKKNILYIDPSKPLVVRETPLYMRGVAGASVSSPGPYEKSANTYYNVTPLDGYSDPKMAESYLREYNHYILQILNIHEAIPGHYTQLVYSNQSPSLVKSLFGNGAMVEGWAVYTERMMLEEGYPNLNGPADPEMWLMYYKWHLRAVCNTILDYSVHVLGLTKDDALKLLIDEAFQQRAEAEGKWRRVSVTQVQLCCYFTGFTEIYDLREEMKHKQGKDFSLKAFHEKFLSYGSAPVKYIKELMTH